MIDINELCSCGRQLEKSHYRCDGTLVFKKQCRTCRGRIENIERKRQISREYYFKNKITELQRCKKWRQQNINKVKQYNILSRQQRNQLCKNRLKVDLNFRLIKYLRTRLYNALKNNQKSGSAIKDLGCSIEEFKKYLESKFIKNMTWDNYGEWHIDHIFPLSKVFLDIRGMFLLVNHYTNLQPIWAEDNIKKGNKI